MATELGRVHVITDKAPSVADSRIVPAGEWMGFTRALTDVNRGAVGVSAATGFLERWGMDSLATIGRSQDVAGRPYGDYGIKPLEGFKRPIATDARMPGGGEGVQLTTDLDKSKPTPPRRRVPVNA